MRSWQDLHTTTITYDRRLVIVSTGLLRACGVSMFSSGELGLCFILQSPHLISRYIFIAMDQSLHLPIRNKFPVTDAFFGTMSQHRCSQARYAGSQLNIRKPVHCNISFTCNTPTTLAPIKHPETTQIIYFAAAFCSHNQTNYW